ncbi:MAG: quinolinate synthase NadA [Methanomicrobiales archaeon]|nr:quinolinate synthase NadA [Methanomicrobiales archaeon]
MKEERGTPCRVAQRFGEILLREEICRLKDQRKALILVHCNQPDAVKGTADVVGDDIALLLAAGASGARELVVCAPRVLAETVQLLLPDARVILPVPEATCQQEREITPADLLAARHGHPGAALVVDVRSPLESKVLADITSTPNTFAEVVASLEEDHVLVALPGLDPAVLSEARAGGKKIHEVQFGSARGEEGSPDGGARTAHTGGSLQEEEAAHPGNAPGEGGFLPLHGTICHVMRQTTLPDLYRSLITGGPCVELPGALFPAARQPVLRMMDVVGRRP